MRLKKTIYLSNLIIYLSMTCIVTFDVYTLYTFFSEIVSGYLYIYFYALFGSGYGSTQHSSSCIAFFHLLLNNICSTYDRCLTCLEVKKKRFLIRKSVFPQQLYYKPLYYLLHKHQYFFKNCLVLVFMLLTHETSKGFM